MSISDFTDTLLPHLLRLYLGGELPFHALVDIDLWQQVFPVSPTSSTQQIDWKKIQLSSQPLTDGTLLLTYSLPQASRTGQPKYVAIRTNPEDRDSQRAVLYTLRKPIDVADCWDVFYLPFPNQEDKTEQRFRCKLEGEDSLCNFVKTVQQISFTDNEYDSSLLSRLKSFLRNALSTIQENAKPDKTASQPKATLKNLFAPLSAT